MTLSLPDHPNIVKLEEIIYANESEERIKLPGGEKSKAVDALVLEALHGGELFYHIIEYGRFNADLARTFFTQITDGCLALQ